MYNQCISGHSEQRSDDLSNQHREHDLGCHTVTVGPLAATQFASWQNLVNSSSDMQVSWRNSCFFVCFTKTVQYFVKTIFFDNLH